MRFGSLKNPRSEYIALALVYFGCSIVDYIDSVKYTKEYLSPEEGPAAVGTETKLIFI